MTKWTENSPKISFFLIKSTFFIRVLARTNRLLITSWNYNKFVSNFLQKCWNDFLARKFWPKKSLKFWKIFFQKIIQNGIIKVFSFLFGLDKWQPTFLTKFILKSVCFRTISSEIFSFDILFFEYIWIRFGWKYWVIHHFCLILTIL